MKDWVVFFFIAQNLEVSWVLCAVCEKPENIFRAQ